MEILDVSGLPQLRIKLLFITDQIRSGSGIENLNSAYKTVEEWMVRW